MNHENWEKLRIQYLRPIEKVFEIVFFLRQNRIQAFVVIMWKMFVCIHFWLIFFQTKCFIKFSIFFLYWLKNRCRISNSKNPTKSPFIFIFIFFFKANNFNWNVSSTVITIAFKSFNSKFKRAKSFCLLFCIFRDMIWVACCEIALIELNESGLKQQLGEMFEIQVHLFRQISCWAMTQTKNKTLRSWL